MKSIYIEGPKDWHRFKVQSKTLPYRDDMESTDCLPSAPINYAEFKERRAGSFLLRTPCRGAHGTVLMSILTFEIAVAMQHENVNWLGSAEYWDMRNKAEEEAETSLLPRDF